jgi:hypothetical protein
VVATAAEQEVQSKKKELFETRQGVTHLNSYFWFRMRTEVHLVSLDVWSFDPKVSEYGLRKGSSD